MYCPAGGSYVFHLANDWFVESVEMTKSKQRSELAGSILIFESYWSFSTLKRRGWLVSVAVSVEWKNLDSHYNGKTGNGVALVCLLRGRMVDNPVEDSDDEWAPHPLAVLWKAWCKTHKKNLPSFDFQPHVKQSKISFRS